MSQLSIFNLFNNILSDLILTLWQRQRPSSSSIWTAYASVTVNENIFWSHCLKHSWLNVHETCEWSDAIVFTLRPLQIVSVKYILNWYFPFIRPYKIIYCRTNIFRRFVWNVLFTVEAVMKLESSTYLLVVFVFPIILFSLSKYGFRSTGSDKPI